ncbi:MAG: hypothetical protein H8E16_14430, partial [Flavobacteriales bacterium]|nr:hypothetical protein [Flavobacteriales bacterium]
MFEYEGEQYTLADLQKSATEQGYDNFDEFMQMYVNNGMKQISDKGLNLDMSSQQPFGQEDKLKYYGGTSELAYYEDEGFFGETIDREIVNIGTRGVNSFIKAIKGIGGYGVALEIAASDWYGKNIKNETEEEKNLRQEQIRINQQNNIYKETFDPIIEGLEKAYIQSDKGVTEQFNAGNYSAMSRQIVSGGVESIPSLVAAYSGIGGLSALAVSVGGEKFEQEFEREPEKSSAQLLLNATGSGVIEAGFELVTRGIMQKAGILKSNNQIQQAKEVIEEGSKAIVIAMGVGGEALAESSTQLTSLLYDQLTLDRKIDWPKAKYEIFDAGIIGGFVGGNITSFGAYTKSTPEAKQRAINILTHPTVNKKIKEHAENINKLIGNLAEASPEGKKLIQKEINKEYLEIQGLRNRSEQGLLNLNKEELQQYAKNIEESVKLGGIINSKTESLEAKNIAKKQNEALVKSNLAMLDVSSERTLEANLAIAKDADAKLGLEQVIIETDAEFAALPQGESGADGFIADGKVYINREIASKLASVSVGSHELLHGVTAGHLLGSDGLVTKQGIEFIDDMRNRMSSKERAIVEKRIEDNYKYERDKDGEKTRTKDKNEYYDEYLNVFHDAIVKKQITYNPTIEKIGQVFSKMFRTKGFDNIKFDNGKDVYDFVKTYSKDILKGKVSKETIAFAKPTTSDVSKKSVSKDQTNSVNELAEMGWTNETWKESGADFAIKEMQANKMLDGLIRSKYKADVVPDNFVGLVYSELVNHVKNFKPEQNDNLFGWINSQIANKAGNVYNREFKVADEMKGAKDIGKTTKEGEVKVQVAAEKSAEMEAFEEEDLSIQGQAKKAKADKQRYSEYRRKLGFETGSKIYNEVLDNVKKSLMMAYGTTQNITDVQLRSKAIATKLKKEYANLNSPLFKQIKNFLTYGVADTYVKRGTKDIYISNLKKFREDIVKNTSTADLVQMERNTPEADRIFTNFVKTLTSIEQVQDAVNREQLPPDALNKITKDKKTGKGAFSPSLYNKIMPTETELVSWADQPGINPVTGARQGLKGTRKDGLAMRMVNGLVTDAIMEARQSEEVQNKIANMDIDPGSVAELGAAIGREVNVKFSKSNAIGDVTAAIDGAGDINVYSQIKFSKSHREAYEKQLTKRRPDLTEDQRKNAVQSVFDFVNGKEIPNHKKSKYEKMAMHYTANGFLILPEDGYKVIEAEKIATQKKLDPFSFKNPNVIIETYVGEVKGTRTNPDNVKTFSNKTQFAGGVTVYNVEDSKQGQADTRKVIDTHFGKESNPWCLAARTKSGTEGGDVITTVEYNGLENVIKNQYLDESYEYGDAEILVKSTNKQKVEKLVAKLLAEYSVNGTNKYKYKVSTEQAAITSFGDGQKGDVQVSMTKIGQPVNLDNAWVQWKHYNKEGNGHQIAFQNGRLVAFRDGKNEAQWWDRNDKPTSGVVVRGKKVDGFKEVIEVDKTKETLLYYEKVTGNKKNGTTIEKDLDGSLVLQETKKDGQFYGEQIRVKDKGEYKATFTENYRKGGERFNFKEERVYSDKNASVRTNVGKGVVINLNNITKYERSFAEKDFELSAERIIIEGTVNQKYFKEFNDPSSATGWEKTNLPYLTPTYERYYGIQGQKVTVVETNGRDQYSSELFIENKYPETIREADRIVEKEIAKGRTAIVMEREGDFYVSILENVQEGNNVTVDGVVQAPNVKFSKSATDYKKAQNAVKFSRMSSEAKTKLSVKLGVMQRNISEEETSHQLLGVILDNITKFDTYQEFYNTTVKDIRGIYNENEAVQVGNVLLEGVFNESHLKKIIDIGNKPSLKEVREISVGIGLEMLGNRIKNLTDEEQQGSEIVSYVKGDGRSIRSGQLKGIRTNMALFDKEIKKLLINDFLQETIKAYTFNGKDGRNKTAIKYKGEKITTFLHPSTIKRVTLSGNQNNINEVRQTIFDEASINLERMFKEFSDPKIKTWEKLASLEVKFLDQMGELRKSYPLGGYMVGKQHNSNNTTLEHNPPVVQVKEIWRQFIMGKIKAQDVRNWYAENKASVNVISKGLNDVLTAEGLSQKSNEGQNRYEHPNFVSHPDYKNFKFSKSLSPDLINKKHSKTLSNAIQFSRSANNPTKGITVLDFDDTLATSKSMIRFTRPDGTKGTLNAEQYASTYESLSDLGYKFDFSEFTKVVDGKTAPLFNKAMKLQGKFGPENMFVLTARPAESAAAIHAFLKANGLNIPLKNITGLANSTSEAKALWIADKVGEGYNDFYFADDALQNVQAVQNMLDQFDVKSKVQQARVKFSKNMDTEFNNILENITGIESKKRFSIIKGRKRGESKGKFRFFIPPSH